jgi:hypothetical protein
MRVLQIKEIELVSGVGVNPDVNVEMEWRYVKTVQTVTLPDGTKVVTVTYEWKLVSKASAQF